MCLFAEAAPRTIAVEDIPGVKAAWTVNIGQYTSWPTRKAQEQVKRGSLVIGVIGADPNKVIELILQRDSKQELIVKDLRIAIARVPQAIEIEAAAEILAPCDLLFVSADASDEWRRLHSAVAAHPIITIGEFAGFANQGGMVEFTIGVHGGKHMRVNIGTLREAGLSLSSKFLRHVDVVQ